MSSARPQLRELRRPENEDGGAGTMKVLIADDHRLIVAGLRHALESENDIEIVGEAHTGSEMMALIERRAPGLVLVALHLPGFTGTEGIERIRLSWPEVKVVVLSASDDAASIDSALGAGASAYIVKSILPADVASVLRQVSGGSVFHSVSAGASSDHAEVDLRPNGPDLTERESTILAAVGAGLTTTAIGQKLWISDHTVKFHITNIYRKLGVTNRAGAVRYAVEHNLAEHGLPERDPPERENAGAEHVLVRAAV